MPDPVQITREDHTSHGAYRAAVEGTEIMAELTWRASGNARIAEHTFTPPEARGKGIAQALVKALVEDAREQGFTVIPSCSYVAAQFRRHPEWAGQLSVPSG